MRAIPTFTCAALVAGATANRKITSPGWDKYAEERGFRKYDIIMSGGDVYARDVGDVDPEVVRAWKHAHRVHAPVYKPVGGGDLMACDSMAFEQHDDEAEEHSRWSDHQQNISVLHLDEGSVDMFLYDYDRHFLSCGLLIPHFDGPEVDTTLKATTIVSLPSACRSGQNTTSTQTPRRSRKSNLS